MIIDQLFEEEKKKLNEIDPRNYDSDEDYYNDLHGDGDEDEDEVDGDDFGDDSTDDMANDEESYYEKSLRSRGLGESRLNEAMLMEDPVYRKFKGVGRYIAERKMSEKEILQVFADAEAGMTDKATGANRTFLGRGKDTTMDFAGGVKDAMTSVLNSIQNSTPVAAVDVAYDQATDALANVTGGQKGAVMGAIKKYRNLVKQYPKTAGFAKAALVAIAGLATGGAGLPAIAGLTYALDSAIKGDKLSSVLGKGAGAAALSAAGQAAFGGNAAPTDDVTAIDAVDVPGGAEATDYVVKKGDTLSDIAKANKVSVDDLMKANSGQTIVKPDGESITWNNDNPLTDVNPMGDYQGPGTGVQQDYSVSTSPKIANPDVLAAGQTIKIPAPTGATPYAGDVGLAGDTWNKIGAGQYPASQISANQAAKYGLKESIKFKIIPAEKLIDQKSTVLSWALSESVGRKSHSLSLTTIGTYTVFENVDRYRKAVMELKGVPGSTRPDYYRPDMMDAPTKPDKKPGLIGRGLNWLDKKAGQVGGALSNFGHQFTTGVTKEKLKMNWHQAGKPSDSDQLAAWLTKQGVPQEVVTTVYGKMGIPYAAPASAEPAATEPATQVAEPAKQAGGAQKSLPFYGTNPDTGKAWTRDELTAKADEPATAPTTATTAQNPAGFNAANVMKMPGMEKYAKKAAPAKTPNFAGPSGYSNVTTSFKQPGAVTPAATTAAPTAPKAPGVKYNLNLPAGGGAGVKAAAQPGQLSKDEYIKRIGADAMPESRVFSALKAPIAEMLQMVETKEDVAKIKQFIDQTFVKYGAVTESAFAVRNQLIEHVTQVGAQRRREFARKG